MMEEKWLIDGEVFVPKIAPVQGKATFKESHTRITTYLENNLHLIIQMLLEHGQIETFDTFINESIKCYLMHEKNDFGSNE